MAGAEYKLTDQLTVGGGYHFVGNPMDHKFFLPIADMIVQHHLSVGATYRTKRWWLGGGYLIGLPNTMTKAERSDTPHYFVRKHREIEQMQHSLFVGMGINW
jgi:long-subunit fatty acid transport protein